MRWESRCSEHIDILHTSEVARTRAFLLLSQKPKASGEGVGIPDVGILGFTIRDLFSWGEPALTTIEQTDCWLGQAAVIPIQPVEAVWIRE